MAQLLRVMNGRIPQEIVGTKLPPWTSTMEEFPYLPCIDITQSLIHAKLRSIHFQCKVLFATPDHRCTSCSKGAGCTVANWPSMEDCWPCQSVAQRLNNLALAGPSRRLQWLQGYFQLHRPGELAMTQRYTTIPAMTHTMPMFDKFLLYIIHLSSVSDIQKHSLDVH